MVRYWIVKAVRPDRYESVVERQKDSHGRTKRKFTEEKFYEYVERDDRRRVAREGNGKS